MANQTIPQTNQFSNTWIVLSSGSLVRVPDGADPDAFRRYAQAKEDRELNPKPAKKQTYHRQDNGSKRNRRARMVFAGHIAGAAMARRMDELAEETFVSGIEWDIPFMGEPVPYESEADDYAVQQGW